MIVLWREHILRLFHKKHDSSIVIIGRIGFQCYTLPVSGKYPELTFLLLSVLFFACHCFFFCTDVEFLQCLTIPM